MKCNCVYANQRRVGVGLTSALSKKGGGGGGHVTRVQPELLPLPLNAARELHQFLHHPTNSSSVNV